MYIIYFLMENSNNNFKAIIYVLLGMTVFAIQDTFIKLILHNTNLYLIYFVRSTIGLIVIIIYLSLKKLILYLERIILP